MKKYVVKYKGQNDVTSSNTFDKVNKMLNFIKMAFDFGIKEVNVEQFNVTENE